jgi:glycosyltransferase involved in cell wall biosynthesis
MTASSIDVIIPLYNNERFIARAMRSVLDQTRPPQRLIVVDDGSQDGGADTVRTVTDAYTGPVGIELLQQPNSGPSAARNAGLRISTASHVAFLDADDLWSPRKLERQMAWFEQGPSDLVMVYTLAHAIDADDVVLPDPPIVLKERPLRGRIFHRLLPVNLIVGSASGVLLTREVLARSGDFDGSLRGLEDIDLWLRVSREGTVDVVEEDLVGLRQHARNTQKDTTFMLGEMLKFYRKWYDEGRSRPDVLHVWAHLIAEFALKAKDPMAARQLVESTLPRDMRKVLFGRTLGSVRLHMMLKRLRTATS